MSRCAARKRVIVVLTLVLDVRGHSAELYAIPDDYEDVIDYDTAETLETVRRQEVSE